MHAGVRALAVALLLAGCAPGGYGGSSQSVPLPSVATKIPRYSDPLDGLYPIPASAVPRDKPINYYAPGGGTGKPGRAVLTMALVPGANYQKLKAYLEQAKADAKTGAPGSAGTIAYDLRLDPVLKSAVQAIKQRYPWVELTDDIATAAKRDVSLTLVLDIRSRLGRPGGAPTAVQVELIAFDAQHKPYTRFIGEGTAAAGGSDGYEFQKAAQNALAALDAKSKTLFN